MKNSLIPTLISNIIYTKIKNKSRARSPLNPFKSRFEIEIIFETNKLLF